MPAPKRAREATATDLKPGRDSDAPSPHPIQLLDRFIGDRLKAHAEQQTEKLASVMRSCEERIVTSLEGKLRDVCDR